MKISKKKVPTTDAIGILKRITGSILAARRRSVSRGSDMPPACHSTPLPFEPGFTISFFGADYGARTRHLNLGKVALYRMS